MQEHLYHKPILDVAALKRCLTAAWSGLQQHVIKEAIDQWRGRLCACVTIMMDDTSNICFDII